MSLAPKTSEQLMDHVVVQLAYLSEDLSGEELRHILEFIYGDNKRTSADVVQYLTNLKKADQHEFLDGLIVILIYLLRDELTEAMNSGF